MHQMKVADLDKGFDECGNLVDGMIYGKMYQISLISAPSGRHIRSSFRLRYTGHDDILTGEGPSVAFQVPDVDCCGRALKVTAYDEGQLLCHLDVWVHYRFRFFSRIVVERELDERRKNAWKIDQRSTALCGIACIFYLLASNQPDQYLRSVRELHRLGYAFIDSYEIRPPASLYEMNPDNTEDYPSGMPYADWISLASVRSKESRWGYRGRKKEVFSAINWPPMLMRLGRSLLGYKTVRLRLYSPIKTYLSDLVFSNKKMDILFNNIHRAHDAGTKIVLMIDMDMLLNRSDYSVRSLVRYHWIVYEGELRMVDQYGTTTADSREASMIYFESYTWGLPLNRSPTSKGISRNAFIRNFYGYIEMAPGIRH